LSSGALLVLSGPSGAGKTTIARRLAAVPGVARVMTATTRARRPQEVDGRDYRFLTRAEFEAEIGRGGFLEHAEIDGNLYGTPRAAIEKELAAGRVVLVDIDVQGARSVREMGLPALFIFVEPPSVEELRRRLEGRRSEGPAAVEQRMERALREMAQKGLYDAVVVNDTVDRAVDDILAEARKRNLLR
jgi:guanylate kinase